MQTLDKYLQIFFVCFYLLFPLKKNEHFNNANNAKNRRLDVNNNDLNSEKFV